VDTKLKMGKIPNLAVRIFASTFWMGVFSGGGYFLYTYTKNMGTEAAMERMKKERLHGRADQTPGKEQMFMDTLLGKGPASLTELRKITTEKRYRIAEENTVYAVAREQKLDVDADQTPECKSDTKLTETKISDLKS